MGPSSSHISPEAVGLSSPNKMKTEICQFSGYKIYPGHGRRYARTDMKTFVFINSKAEKAFLKKSNPRKVLWTTVYRRIHKKGATPAPAKGAKGKKVAAPKAPKAKAPKAPK